MGWKENKREQGFRDVLVWLDPAAVAGLEQLKAAHPGVSVAEIISRAVTQAAEETPGKEQHPTAIEERLGVAEDELRNHKDSDLVEKQDLWARIEALESFVQMHAPTVLAGDGGVQPSLESYRKSSLSYDAALASEDVAPDGPTDDGRQKYEDPEAPKKRTRAAVAAGPLNQTVTDRVKQAGVVQIFYIE